MKNLIRFNDYNKSDILNIFDIVEKIRQGEYKNFLLHKTVVLFFPPSSIRTRITFEKGIYLLGGQSILFPSETLEKNERIEDVVGYLNNWADAIIVRHNKIELIDEIAKYSKIPIINAMTKVNHPCEVLSDLYALSKMRSDYLEAHYLFVGAKGNIGLAWKEASALLGFPLTQSCPVGYEMDNTIIEHNICHAIKNKDIVLTDSLSVEQLQDFKNYQISSELMQTANNNALLNPCPPFYRGEEVSSEVINTPYFVGYEFKKFLLEVQQAIIIFNMLN